MYVRQALDLFEGLLLADDNSKEFSVDQLRKLIVFSMMWSLGALLELDDRKKVCCCSLEESRMLLRKTFFALNVYVEMRSSFYIVTLT